jgi:molybdopterin/thiamine biosynthesis adenylyltransferase
MDGYYAQYFPSFAPGRPYVSLIAAIIDGKLALSGRAWWGEEWLRAEQFCVERTPVQTWVGTRPKTGELERERTARLNAAFGQEAAARLRHATVAIIGAGGSGSAAIETLARAGVGRLIIVDPERIAESNLERVHGSDPSHVKRELTKVALAREHVHAIDPTCEVVGLVGSLPQDAVIDAVITADVVLGCTDQQHSRLAISDLAVRFLVPAIDCGVALEGADGKVSGQIVQLVRCLAADPCVLCRGMISPQRVGEELMSLEERKQRTTAAQDAIARGEDPDPYWHGAPQLNTVGYLTTAAGALAAGYAIGWLTGRFDPPFSRLQMNLTAPFLDVTDDPIQARSYCACRRIRGWADQGSAERFVTAPTHWTPVENVS